MHGLSSPLCEAEVAAFIRRLQAAGARCGPDHGRTAGAVADLVGRHAIPDPLAVLCAAVGEQAAMSAQDEPPLVDVFARLVRELCGAPASATRRHAAPVPPFYSMPAYRGFVDGV